MDDAQVTLRETIALSLSGLPDEAVAAFHALGAFAPAGDLQPGSGGAVTEAGAATLALLIARNLLERSDGEAERLALHQVLADVADQAGTNRDRTPSRLLPALVDEDREDWQRIQTAIRR
ncbi:MAG: hypothetical protein H6649_12625 [Caldilineae bacterium]|nr:hypothetical protein [Caldilineae bacterium]